MKLLKNKLVLVFISLLAMILVFVALFYAYLQFSTFQLPIYDSSPLISYLQNAKGKQGLFAEVSHRELTEYEFQLSRQHMEEEVSYLLQENEEAKGVHVQGIQVDLTNKSARMNYKMGGFYVPVNQKISYEIKDDVIRFRFQTHSYGKWKLKVVGFLEKVFFPELIKEKEVVFDTAKYVKSRFLTPSKLSFNTEGLVIGLYLQIPKSKELIEELRENLDEELTEAFYAGTSEQKTALSWVYEYERKEEEILPLMYEDFHQGAKVIRELLVLANPDVLTKIYAQYPELAEVISKVEVIEDRSLTIGDSVIEYAQEILKAISFLSTETSMLICYGKPYDYAAMTEVTISKINEMYQLGLDEDTLKQMEFSYTDGILYVIFDTNEGQYIVSYSGDFEVVDQEEYSAKYKKKTLLNGWFTTSPRVYKDVYDALYAYYEQDVFIRYLKDDGNDAFAIVSLYDNYQNLKIVALKESEVGFRVLNDNYSTLKEINREFSDFNLNLGTKVFETTSILRLNDSTIESVEIGLKDQGFLEEGERMIYCSFDGLRYISILLDSGEKYIYTVYRSNYLEKVYTLEDALKTFDDIDPLILLQEVPVEIQVEPVEE